MSKFSGRCDFYDHIAIEGFDEVKKERIYLGVDINLSTGETKFGKQIKIESIKDCVPYYPYIIMFMAADGDGGTIVLTEKSWVDMMEEKYGHSAICDYYRSKLKEEMKKYE